MPLVLTVTIIPTVLQKEYLVSSYFKITPDSLANKHVG